MRITGGRFITAVFQGWLIFWNMVTADRIQQARIDTLSMMKKRKKSLRRIFGRFSRRDDGKN